MSEEYIKDALKYHGFINGCSDWHEYSRAKKIILKGEPLSTREYDAAIKVITEYLDV